MANRQTHRGALSSPAAPLNVSATNSPPAFLSSQMALALAIILLLCFLIVGLIEAQSHTPTVDEFAYLPMGLSYWRSGQFDIDRRGPPLMKMWGALPLLVMGAKLPAEPQWRGDGEGWWPWIYGTRFMQVNSARYFSLYMAGRTMMVLIGVAGGLLVWHWAKCVHGRAIALGCLLLYCTSPTVIAHSAVATLDIGVCVFVLASFYTLWRWTGSGRLVWAAVTGAAFGLALASKFSALFLLPLIPALAAIRWRDWRSRQSWIEFTRGLALAAFSCWLTIECAYLFQGLPLPNALIAGVRYKSADQSTGECLSFLLGSWSDRGWRAYYLVAMMLKFTIPFLILLLISLVVSLRRRDHWRNDLWFILPPLLLCYVLSFHYFINYGIRYLLPGIPFLFLFCGRGFEHLSRHAVGRVALVALLAWQSLAFFGSIPHHLSYFNELAGGPEYNRRQLLDSNLDWGQDLGALRDYLNEAGLGHIGLAYFGHVDPRLYGIKYSLPPREPTPGWYAVSANYLGGYPYAITYAGVEPVTVPPGAWTWFNRFRPVAIAGRSIFIYRITAADVELHATHYSQRGA